MIEAVFEVLGELLLQVGGEFVFELLLRSLKEPFRKQPGPVVAAFGYAFYGTALGGLSLLVLPAHLVPGGGFRVLNLALTPIVVGLCMVALGAWRARHGQRVLRIDRFWFGYLFALAFAVVRFCWAD